MKTENSHINPKLLKINTNIKKKNKLPCHIPSKKCKIHGRGYYLHQVEIRSLGQTETIM